MNIIQPQNVPCTKFCHQLPSTTCTDNEVVLHCQFYAGGEGGKRKYERVKRARRGDVTELRLFFAPQNVDLLELACRGCLHKMVQVELRQ